MAKTNAILKMKVEGILKEIWLKSGATDIVVDEGTGETLATRLASIASDLESAVAGGVTTAQVNSLISAAIDDLINGAPATYDTLKEIADYLASHQNEYTALVQTVGTKVDKVEGKGLSTNDFTTALMNKLNGIAEGATKVEKSSTNGNIKVNGIETQVYAHPTGAGNEHLPSGGTVGQVLRAKGSGQGEWGVNIRSGASEPNDLAEGELFVQFVD